MRSRDEALPGMYSKQKYGCIRPLATTSYKWFVYSFQDIIYSDVDISTSEWSLIILQAAITNRVVYDAIFTIN